MSLAHKKVLSLIALTGFERSGHLECLKPVLVAWLIVEKSQRSARTIRGLTFLLCPSGYSIQEPAKSSSSGSMWRKIIRRNHCFLLGRECQTWTCMSCEYISEQCTALIRAPLHRAFWYTCQRCPQQLPPRGSSSVTGKREECVWLKAGWLGTWAPPRVSSSLSSHTSICSLAKCTCTAT